MDEFADFIAGSPAREGDFFFRRAYIGNLWESLRKEHVLIIAPRRMGKTSVMLRLQDEPEDGRLVVFLNVEEINTPAEFCQSLITALHEQQPDYVREMLAKASHFLGGVLARIKEVEVYKFKIALRESEANWEENWRAKAEELVDCIRQTGQPLLIILDELPDMVLNMKKKSPEALGTFLHWFREVRQDPRHDNIRWLVGGSVNLRSTLDQQRMLNLINDLRVEPLPPFSDEEVETFLRTMLEMRRVSFRPDVVDTVKQLLGKPIPLFLQLLTQELYRDWRKRHEELRPDHVHSVFRAVLLGEVARDKLQHFRSRIYTHYPDDEKNAALDLLDRLSRSDEPLTRDGLFTAYDAVEAAKPRPRAGQELKQAFCDLLILLQNDFYIEETDDGRLDFACRTLKLWWRKNYA